MRKQKGQSPRWFGGIRKRKVSTPKVFLTIKIFSPGSNLLSTADLWFGLLLLPQSWSGKKLCHHHTQIFPACFKDHCLNSDSLYKLLRWQLLCILNHVMKACRTSIGYIISKKILGTVARNIKLSLAWMDHLENKKWRLQFQIPGSGLSISGTISLSRSAGVSGLQ